MSSLAGHISIHSGLIILKLFVNDSELGKFALANRIAFLLRMIPVFIIQSVLQNASKINQNNSFNLNNYLNYYFKMSIIHFEKTVKNKPIKNVMINPLLK